MNSTNDDSKELNISQIPIFVVTIDTGNSERLDRLINRLKYFSLYDQTQIVYGHKYDSELVKYYAYRHPQDAKIYSCAINHFLAIKQFIKIKQEYGLILEDDAIFHVDFVNKVNELLKDPPQNLLLLSFTHGRDYHNSLRPKTGLNPITHWTCGCNGYILSRDYAILTLSLFDKPGINFIQPEKNTSEVTTIFSNSNYINPPLIIEEAIGSILGHNTDWHLNCYTNYCDLEDFLIENEDVNVVKKFKAHKMLTK
jgi:GR25 family glycosyltransferase involved in LPS biosynthesis